MTRFLRTRGWEGMLVLLIVLAFVWGSMLSPYFLDTVNLLNSAQYLVMFSLMAFGLFPIIVQGEIDISLASTLAVGSVLLAQLSTAGVPLVVGLPLVLVVCALLGAINGLLVAGAGLPSLAVTLGTMGAYRGIAYVLSGSDGITGLTPEYTALGSTWVGIVPASLFLIVGAGIAFAVLMGTTSFGRFSYAIGNGAAATRMAGAPVLRTRVTAYALAGAMAGLAGLVWVGQYQSARGDNADGSILFVLTAVVLGGVSIKGGSGRALGVLLAIALLGTIQTAMQLANVPGTAQTLVIGVLLVGSIGIPLAIGMVRSRFSRGRGRPAPSPPDRDETDPISQTPAAAPATPDHQKG